MIAQQKNAKNLLFTFTSAHIFEVIMSLFEILNSNRWVQVWYRSRKKLTFIDTSLTLS
jgi:hypothetical protein